MVAARTHQVISNGEEVVVYKKKVEVFWRDAVYQGGWQDPEDFKSTINDSTSEECSTIGYVIEDNDQRIVLAMSVGPNEDHQLGNTWTIPKGMVTAIVEQVTYTPTVSSVQTWEKPL